MTTPNKTRITIPPAIAQLAQIALTQGRYDSLEQIVDEALQEWVLHHFHPSQENAVILGQLWDEGLQSGEPMEAGPFLERLKQKYAQPVS
jgi:muramidase (phage lysozyme)